MGTSGTAIAQAQTRRSQPLTIANFFLVAFFVVTWARPEDWIPGFSIVPLAKITGILTLVAFGFSLGHIRQRLPREVVCLILLTGQLFFAAALSPVWRGGAFLRALDFAKVLLVVIVITVSVNTTQRLRRLIFIQAASIAVIAAIAVWKGRLLVGRLEGVLSGNYSNANGLALLIVITLPLSLALLFLSRRILWKVGWTVAILVMTYAVFLTASRAGFISLIVMTAVVLWEFGIKRRRYYLLALTAVVGIVLWLTSAGMLNKRLQGTFDPTSNVASAYGSSEARQALFWRSIDVTMEHPLFGVGPGDFPIISGTWRVTHNSYTEMSSEGGVPALIFYVLILSCGFRNVSTTKRLARRQKKLILLAQAFNASLAGYVVGSVFDSVAYQFFPYILVAYTTVLFCIAKKSAASSKEHEATTQIKLENELYANPTATEMSWHSR